jgi:hypothetical protein
MRTYQFTKPITWADKNNPQVSIFTDWMWGTATYGDIKVWSGTAWVAKPVKVWNGSAWIIKPAKVWNGTAWRITNY